MAAKALRKQSVATKARSKMSPEMKKAYAQVKMGVRGIGESITDIQRGLQKAEQKVRSDAQLRIRTLRADARTQLTVLRRSRGEAAQALKRLTTAAEGSWHDVKKSADSILAQARVAAGSVTKRFRKALAG